MMMVRILLVFIFVNSLVANVRGSYPCLCTYQVESNVYASKSSTSTVLGSMYEFDCKPTYPVDSSGDSHFITVQFEHQLGYVENVPGMISIESCAGSMSSGDVVTTPSITATSPRATSPTTTTTATTTPRPKTTTTNPTTTTTNPTTTTTTTAKPTTPMPTTTTTTPMPTTTTTTPMPTTTTPMPTTTTPMPTTTTPMPTTTTPMPTTTTTTPMPTTTTLKPTTPIPTTATTTTMATTTLPVMANGCPAGWIKQNDQCYLISQHEPVTHAQAVAKCLKSNAHLVIIDSSAKQLMVQHLAHQHNHNTLWTAGVFADHHAWKWINDVTNTSTPISYTHWSNDFPHHFSDPSQDKCVAKRGDGYWNDLLCTRTFNYMCERPVQAYHASASATTKTAFAVTVTTSRPLATTTSHTSHTTSGCPNGWTQYYQTCYYFNQHDKLTYNQAKTSCQQKGSHLAIIDSDSKQHFIENVLSKFSFYHDDLEQSAVWTAGVADHHQHWTWDNGETNTPFNYQSWTSRYHRKYFHHTCAAVVGSLGGDWLSFDCDHEHFHYMCERPTQSQMAVTQAPNHAHCPNGWKQWYTSCYYVDLQHSRTYDDAKTQCESQGAHLVFIETVQEQNFLKQYIPTVHHYHSHSAPTWIGAVYDHHNHAWRWSSSFLAKTMTYHNWNGQPGGDCTWMHSGSDFRWQPVDCDARLYPICEINLSVPVALIG